MFLEGAEACSRVGAPAHTHTALHLEVRAAALPVKRILSRVASGAQLLAIDVDAAVRSEPSLCDAAGEPQVDLKNVRAEILAKIACGGV